MGHAHSNPAVPPTQHQAEAGTSSLNSTDPAVAAIEAHSHFTHTEFQRIRTEFERIADANGRITKEQFKQTIGQSYVATWAAGNLFIERLFDAFDINGDHTIDFAEFVEGLSIFAKGTPEEKLELSFRVYDINRDGFISRKELFKIMSNMYSTFYNEDQSERIKEMVEHFFDDLDVNGDDHISIDEYRLQAMKEPIIVDFLEQFLNRPPPSPVGADKPMPSTLQGEAASR